MDKLEELVYVSIGHASMCWSERPKGVFDSAEARKVAEALLQGINEHVQNVIGLERAKWQLSHPHIIRDVNGQEIARSKGLDIFEKTYELVEEGVERERIHTAEANAEIAHMKGLL